MAGLLDKIIYPASTGEIVQSVKAFRLKSNGLLPSQIWAFEGRREIAENSRDPDAPEEPRPEPGSPDDEHRHAENMRRLDGVILENCKQVLVSVMPTLDPDMREDLRKWLQATAETMVDDNLADAAE
jgi:hypothetical protein